MNTKDKTEYNRNYYLKNREKVIADAKAYYEANKEEVTIKKKEYRVKNHELLKAKDRAYYRNKYRKRMLSHAKTRQRLYGHELNIDIDDIIIPDTCPLLGIPLYISEGRKSVKANSPSLDRIDPKKGYIKGNVWVISHRANTIKSDASLDDMILLIENWKQQRELGYPTPELAERFKEKETT